jgi:hypothetical protein
MNRESILIAIFILSFLSFAIYVNAFTIQDLANSISQIFSTSQNTGTTGGFNFFQWIQNLFNGQPSAQQPLASGICCCITGSNCQNNQGGACTPEQGPNCYFTNEEICPSSSCAGIPTTSITPPPNTQYYCCGTSSGQTTCIGSNQGLNCASYGYTSVSGPYSDSNTCVNNCFFVPQTYCCCGDNAGCTSVHEVPLPTGYTCPTYCQTLYGYLCPGSACLNPPGGGGTTTSTSTTTTTGGGGTDPCTQAGVCWGSNNTAVACSSNSNPIGFCIPTSLYNQHPQDWFITVPQGNYRCGPNFCLIANANDDGCWGTRGFCYWSVDVGTGTDQSTTGCFGSTTAAETECMNRGGNLCSGTMGSNVVKIDPATAYGSVICQSVAGGATTTTTTGTGGGGGGTTTTTAGGGTTTTTVSTTTTTSTVQQLIITCPTCFANTACSCSIPSNSCGSGEWIAQNLNNNPLPTINITTIPPYTVYFFPNQTGTVNVTAHCFDVTNPRSNSTTVTVQNPVLVCPASCAPSSSCTCTVNNCNSGLFLATSSASNAVIAVQPFSTNPYSATFTAPQTGVVNVVATCDNPLLPSAKAIIQIGGTSTTTSTSVVPGAFTHSNFRCLQVGNKWTCTISYNNQVGQAASLVYFLFSQNAYKNSKSVTISSGSGVSSPVVFDCGVEGSGTYSVSLKVYLSDLRINPIDWSLSTETQTVSC